ncbi:hypothetical protein GIB67_025597 [Kingdonia uniflora]|uniref:Uncharacterized protein n=1 Tax=Kingdonia uniflora TaxID=39325 RepID=A0A7J7M0S0_9MAGN|nr:hypothetical protein GIB67_025597 [Kingdonia uniflora]
MKHTKKLCLLLVLISAKEEPDASIPSVIDGLLRVHKRTVDSLDVDLSNPLTPLSFLKGEGTTFPKLAIPSRTSIQIRKTLNGGITLAGVTEPEVRSKEEMATYFSRGSLAHATGSTNMNSQSRDVLIMLTGHQKKQKIWMKVKARKGLPKYMRFYEWNVFHPLEKPQKRLGTFFILQLALHV